MACISHYIRYVSTFKNDVIAPLYNNKNKTKMV
jgi:hypothetical protein